MQRLCHEAWLAVLTESKAVLAGVEGAGRTTAEGGEMSGEDTSQLVHSLAEGVRKSF